MADLIRMTPEMRQDIGALGPGGAAAKMDRLQAMTAGMKRQGTNAPAGEMGWFQRAMMLASMLRGGR